MNLRSKCSVFALGVGQNWDGQELLDITGGDRSKVFVVDNYSELTNATELALRTICGGSSARKTCILYMLIVLALSLLCSSPSHFFHFIFNFIYLFVYFLLVFFIIACFSAVPCDNSTCQNNATCFNKVASGGTTTQHCDCVSPYVGQRCGE